jgi:hypothetical protein
MKPAITALLDQAGAATAHANGPVSTVASHG